jgi:catechol 2,3-dioxygenase-like lactoylglutathione lyase family enzyme
MPTGYLEHANISVTDPDRSAALLKAMLGWEERWRGPSQNAGHSVHVGNEDCYLALYTGAHVRGEYAKGQPLNHIAFRGGRSRRCRSGGEGARARALRP